MPGPANKHMNARAFSRAHTAVRSRPRTQRYVRARAPELSGGNTRSQTVPEHCLVLLTASGTIYLGCSRWIPFRSPSRPKRRGGGGIPRHLDGITRHRGAYGREDAYTRMHTHVYRAFSFLPFSRFILPLNLLLPFCFPSVSTPL